MPAGVEVTVPTPVPALGTVSGTFTRLNVAVTVAAAAMVTVHAPVPVHPPVQPANTALGPATCVSTTGVVAR